MMSFTHGLTGTLSSLCLLSCGTEVVELSAPVPQRATGVTQFDGEAFQAVGDAPVSSDSSLTDVPASSDRALTAAPPSVPEEVSGQGEPIPAPPSAGVSGGPLAFDDAAEGAAQFGCNKVDLLVAIERSRSMLPRHDVLNESLPGFILSFAASLQIDDIHAMVVETGAGGELDGRDCDDLLGAGRREDGYRYDCGLPAGQRFSSGGASAVAADVACLAAVGSGSLFGRQRQADAVLSALNVGPGDTRVCNSGFLRDDALLVVLLVTEEDDTRSDDEPRDWAARLATAHVTGASGVASLWLLQDGTRYGCDSGSPLNFFPTAEVEEALNFSATPRLAEFAGSLRQSVLGDVCAPDYSLFFGRALATVVGACERFVAPGVGL